MVSPSNLIGAHGDSKSTWLSLPNRHRHRKGRRASILLRPSQDDCFGWPGLRSRAASGGWIYFLFYNLNFKKVAKTKEKAIGGFFPPLSEILRIPLGIIVVAN